MPYTLCDLCIYTIWSYYLKRFGRRCIHKKIQYLTFDTKCCKVPLHHVAYSATKFEVATSNRLGGDIFTRKYIIWPLTLGSRSHEIAQYPLHHVTYSATKFKDARSNGLDGDTLTRNLTDGKTDPKVKVTRNVAHYPLHHVYYSATKIEVAIGNCLGGDAFTRKYIIWLLTLTMGSRSHKMLPSTLYTYDLFSYKI